MAWNTILESIGVRELNEAVQGINEEKIDMESVKSFFGGLKEKVTALFSKLIATLQKYANSASAAIKFNTTFTQKHREDIINGAKAGVSIPGYSYAGMASASKYFNAKPLLKSNAYKLAMGGDEAILNSRYEAQDATADMQKIIGTLTNGKVDVTKREYKAEMVDYLRGSDHKVDIKASGKDLIAILEDKKGMMKAVKDAQDSTKEEFKAVVKALHRLEKAYGKRYTKNAMYSNRKFETKKAVDSSAGYNRAVYLAKVLDRMLKVSAIAKGTILKMVKEQAHQARKLANACVKAAKKSDKGIDESFEYGYLSDLNLI